MRRWGTYRTLVWLAAAILASGTSARVAGAATFVVNDTKDLPDLQAGDGVCATVERTCTLRAAIQEANALPGEDRIQVPSHPLPYRLRIAGLGEEEAATGDLDITDDLIVEGIGPGVAIIDGDLQDRVFDIFPPARVTIRNLVIQRGNVAAAGGGIRNAGTLFLDSVTLRDNAVIAGAGGAVANLPGGRLEVVNCSFANNNAATSGQGGALANLSNAEAALESVTFINNAANAGSAIHNLGQAQVHNTLFGPSSLGLSCSGAPVLSLGYNLDAGSSCGLDQQGDLNNVVNPGVSLPAYHGGFSFTAALQPGSPAIDRGDPQDCPAVDQRGFSRPMDGDPDGVPRCDIGAFEFHPPTPSPTITGTFTPTVPSATPTQTSLLTPSPFHTTPPISPHETPSGTATPSVSPTQFSASPSRTPTTMPTPTPTATGAFALVEVETIRLFSGDTGVVAVRFVHADRPVVAAQAELHFDPECAFVQPTETGEPDCRANADLGKSFLADYAPDGCIGSDCRSVRAFLFSTLDLTTIPVGSVLWTCVVRASPQAPLGACTLTLTDVELADEEGEELSNVQAGHGAVIVVATPTPTPSASATPTATHPATPSPSHSPSPSATPTVTARCVGDCGGDGEVTVDELIRMVNVALGLAEIDDCVAGDRNADGTITIDEIVTAVRVALDGCPQA